MKLLLPTMLALSLTADAGTVLFSDLGSPVSFGNLGSVVQGSNGNTRNWITQAREFTVSGSGNFDVTQIDLAMMQNGGSSAFMAGIFTNDGAVPGTQIGSWIDLTANAFCGASCYPLATQSGITGITLTGGDTYWMVAGPQSSTATTDVLWMDNTHGSHSLLVASLDGGQHWISDGQGTNAAFDVLGDAVVASVPEPSSLILFTAGMLPLVLAIRRRRSAAND
jgi:hypothetical protein